jgi:2-dehydro-3-deoxygluconokinase
VTVPARVMTDLVGVGETMALLASPQIGRLRDSCSLRLSTGGAESNVVIGMQRLGYRTAWVGRVGADELGERILADLRREGVDVSGAVVDEHAATGLMIKERPMASVFRVNYYRKGFAGSRLGPADLPAALLSGARIVHVTGISLGLSTTAAAAVDRAIDLAGSGGALVSFDLNYRSALWTPEEAAPRLRETALRADLVFAGEDELALMADKREAAHGSQAEVALAVAEKLTDGGSRRIVIKRGREGARTLGPDGVVDVPAFTVTEVDPVGAGDAFVAGYLAGELDGLDVQACLRLGCAAGGFVVMQLGDYEGLPSRSDLALLDHDFGTIFR